MHLLWGELTLRSPENVTKLKELDKRNKYPFKQASIFANEILIDFGAPALINYVLIAFCASLI